MSRASRLSIRLVAGLLLIITGCQKLDHEETVQIGAGAIEARPITAPSGQQKVTVSTTSSTCPIDVYVVLETDRTAAEQAILNYKLPEKALASKEKAQEATLEATIPAKTEYAVIVSGAMKDTQVKLKVTGR